MDKYIVKWYDDSNREHTLTIYDTESQTDNTTNLIPGVSPFVSREDADTNPFTAVRTKTATINILTENLPQLNLTSSHRYRVVLVRGSQVEWLGWVSANVMNQDYNSYLGEFSLNAIDDLQALSTWKLDATRGFDIVSLGSILAECFGHTNGVSVGDAYTHLYWPNEYMSLNVYGSSGKIWTDIEVSRFNFFSPAGDNSEDDYVGDDCLTVVQKICTFFGFSLRLIGNKLYFSKIGTTTFFGTNDIANLFAGTYTSSNFTFSSTAKTSLPTPTETDHQINVEQGKREISIKADINEVRDCIPSLSFDNMRSLFCQSVSMIYRDSNTSTTNKYYPYVFRYLVSKNKNLRLPHYRFREAINKQSSVQSQRGIKLSSIYEVEPTEELMKIPSNGDGRRPDASDNWSTDGTNTALGGFGNCFGAHGLSQDYWYGPSVSPGTSSEGKRNFEFEDLFFVYLNSTDTCDEMSAGYGHGGLMYDDGKPVAQVDLPPLIYAKGDNCCVYSAGGFSISMQYHLPDHTGIVSAQNILKMYGPHPLTNGSQINTNEDLRAVFRLQVGQKYWNGSTWTATRCSFEMPLWGQNANSYNHEKCNKVLSMAFTTDNYAIPITQPLAGEIILEFLGFAIATGVSTGNVAFIKGLSFQYCEPTAYYDGDKKKTTNTYKDVNDGWTDDMQEVNLSLCTNNQNPDGYAQLSYNGKLINKFVYLAKEVRPEEHLLEAYQNEFSVSRTILELYVEANDESTPLTYIEQDGKRFVCIAEGERDYTTNKKKLIYREF